LEYQYSVENKLNKINHFNWNEFNQEWDTTYLTNVTYVDTSNSRTEIRKQLNNGAWKNENKKYYKYNNSNILQLYEEYYCADGIDNWYLRDKYAYKYNPETQEEYSVQYYWYNNISELIRYDSIVKSYTNDGQIESEISFRWDTTTQVWKNAFKDVYTYGNTTDSIIKPYYMQGYILQVNHSWWTDEQVWYDDGTAVYYYNEFNTIGNKQVASNDLLIYPNPANNYVIVNTENKNKSSFELYSLKGRLIKSTQVNNNEIINIEGIAPGQYVYSIITPSNKKTGTLIIE
jgi:hypothetical protein